MATQPTSTGPPDRDATHHDVPLHELLLLLESDPERGLEVAEAERRLSRYGPNRLAEQPTTPAWLRLLRQMHNPLIYVLNVSAAVTILLGQYVDASVILGVVVVNTVVGFVQESKAESALDALRSMVHTDALVIRGGAPRPWPPTGWCPATWCSWSPATASRPTCACCTRGTSGPTSPR